jgi:hypothetical protein
MSQSLSHSIYVTSYLEKYGFNVILWLCGDDTIWQVYFHNIQ